MSNGKRGHIALNCRHRSNYAYQGAQPPSSLSANYAYQGSNVSPYNNMELYSPQSHFGNLNQSPPIMNYKQSPQFSSPSMSPPPGFPTMNAQSSAEIANGDSWILDIGAYHHMTPDLTVFP